MTPTAAAELHNTVTDFPREIFRVGILVFHLADGGDDFDTANACNPGHRLALRDSARR